jgi:hypothetical protein
MLVQALRLGTIIRMSNRKDRRIELSFRENGKTLEPYRFAGVFSTKK